MEQKKTTAVIPGSYDPITIGHMNIIERAAAIFERVWIVVVDNSEKSGAGRGLLDYELKLNMVRAAAGSVAGADAVGSNGMLADLAAELGAGIIIRGARNSVDFEYEFTLARINRFLSAGLDTVILPAYPEYSHISSSLARELIKYNRSLRGIIPQAALELYRPE